MILSKTTLLKPKLNKSMTSKSGIWLKRETEYVTYEALVLMLLEAKQRNKDQEKSTGSKTEP